MSSKSTFIPKLPEKPRDRRIWGNAKGLASGFAIAQSLQTHNKLILVLTEDSPNAIRIEQELKFFLDIQDTQQTDIPRVLRFPDYETLPFDNFSPHESIISERLHTLYRLQHGWHGILVVPMMTLVHRLIPREFLLSHSLLLEVGQTLCIDTMRRRLEQAGYRAVSTVYEHGEFALRGSLMDIYPMGSVWPFRIDLIDDEIDTLRTFDPETQRTQEKVKKVQLLPAKEMPLDDQGIKRFRQNFHTRFNVEPRSCPIYQDVSEGIAPPGIEYYLPLFFEQTQTLFDYLPDDCLAFSIGNLEQAIQNFHKDVNSRYENMCVDPKRPILKPTECFLQPDEIFAQLKNFPQVSLTQSSIEEKSGRENLHCKQPPKVAINSRSDDPLASLISSKLEIQMPQLICAESNGRRETIYDILHRSGQSCHYVDTFSEFLKQYKTKSAKDFFITVAPLEQGLYIPDQALRIISEPELFGNRVIAKRRRKRQELDADLVIKNLTELRIGAPVVHLDHGVGRYKGLQTLDIDGQDAEFLTLEYADNAKLYVPVSSLHLIARYSGADDSLAPLHRLGSDKWSKEKRKAQEKIRDVAAELLNIYAAREAKPGYIYDQPDSAYDAFCSTFKFEETPDQDTAIRAVIDDMTSSRPMDRLVCGDVGFGKTEVAMRATFIAVHSGKQVAILAPTTLLAQQHYDTFRNRFADTALNIEVISRFKSKKEQTQVRNLAAQGKIDILIGTHNILQSTTQFKNLGLVIVDEEHRFGVKQKERLKTMRAEVDILTLTATPIPRTLNMAMSGMRDLSIITTPPARRLSIKTFTRMRDTALIKEAILRELLRGGQVYFLHNEVKSIQKEAIFVQELVPEARVVIGHGQMPERELEQVMSDFYHKRANVLVCTTIIENGIDIPSANTIIMNRADKLGLAQLHQLRGRVGRSHHQAYAYLLTPSPKLITSDAKKRLEAIEYAQDLGAGFTLATNDLEIRGAGELLGEEQSGHIHSIGFSLYMEMLERTIEAIKAGKTPNLEQPYSPGSEINLQIPAIIPDDYLADVHTRLIMYKRIANAKDDETLNALQVEMIDRFGLMPDSVKNLFSMMELKLYAQSMGISKIELGSAGGTLDFDQQTDIDPLTMVNLIQSEANCYTMVGATQLKIRKDLSDKNQRLAYLNQLLDKLKPERKTKAA